MLVRDPVLQRKIPNAITVARLMLAGVFFGMLRFYEFGTVAMSWWLFTAGWIYGLAAASDWLDGHLARKWDVQSVFGRVIDPFCDKILVLGTFVFFTSDVFVTQSGENLTGVGPIIVVILLGRELLVTTLRSMSESDGQAMGAKWAGKFKMTFQSIAIPVVLVYAFSRAWLDRGETFEIALRVLRDICVWGTVIVTIWSGWVYLPRRQREMPM